jgi:hypothetical protein
MVFNPADKLVYGLGLAISGQAWNRSIVSFDPVSLQYAQRGQVPAFGIESGGISAINVAAQTMYWIGMKAPYVPKLRDADDMRFFADCEDEQPGGEYSAYTSVGNFSDF